MEEAAAFAPGKLILVGEHAVVYGYPAVALAVSLGTEVRLLRRAGASAIDSAEISDPRLWPALSTILPAEGLGVHIRSNLPVGCGMGSSAALAVATVRAWAKLNGEEADFQRCYEEAFAVERVFHGTPSGIDHTVSAMGGVVRYVRGPEGPVFQRLILSQPLKLVVVDTGPPAQTTAEMVAGVRARAPMAALAAIGQLVEEVVRRLGSGEEIGALLDENQQRLVEIGVSTPALDEVCRRLRQAGARGAKLAGAGGGGVVFGLVGEDQPRVLETMRAAGYRAWGVTAG